MWDINIPTDKQMAEKRKVASATSSLTKADGVVLMVWMRLFVCDRCIG